jgi:hypothetical protein
MYPRALGIFFQTEGGSGRKTEELVFGDACLLHPMGQKTCAFGHNGNRGPVFKIWDLLYTEFGLTLIEAIQTACQK